MSLPIRFRVRNLCVQARFLWRPVLAAALALSTLLIASAGYAARPAPPPALSLTPNWTTDGNRLGALFGDSVGTAGDQDGDGRSEILTTAPGLSDLFSGRVEIYFGPVGGTDLVADWIVRSADPNDSFGAAVGGAGTVSMLQNGSWQGFGFAVSSAGDLNGDGSDDVVVGAPGFSDDQFSEGRVFVFASTQGCAG